MPAAAGGGVTHSGNGAVTHSGNGAATHSANGSDSAVAETLRSEEIHRKTSVPLLSLHPCACDFGEQAYHPFLPAPRRKTYGW
eukprot:gene5952-6828_t